MFMLRGKETKELSFGDEAEKGGLCFPVRGVHRDGKRGAPLNKPVASGSSLVNRSRGEGRQG